MSTSATKESITFYIINLLTNDKIVVDLIPEEVSDATQGQYDEVVPRGRSNPIYGYSTSGPRTVSFTVQLHDDYCPGNHGSIVNYVNRLRALAYPAYNGGSISSPKCLVRVGDMINFTGVCKEVSVTWKKPYRDGFYLNAEVSLSFDEVQSIAKSSSQVAKGDFSN